ncbi:MAG TPA: 50S ribosomal protein L24 [Gammaproteobacteria bacterium]|nr:50S ribosomal protein L24 [Gammaproteobacteria bacterium]
MRKIKTGDDVIVTAGRDKGRTGRVLKVLPDDRVMVENANLVKKHTRPDPNRGVAGGIVEKEAPMHISNVMLYNPRSKKGDRVGFRTLDDGRKVRYFKSDNEVVDL